MSQNAYYEERPENPHSINIDSLDNNWPQPWCRICKKGVSKWVWGPRIGNYEKLSVECHGEKLEGFMPCRIPNIGVIPEAFAFDEPHLTAKAFWYVGLHGQEIQPYREKLFLDRGIIVPLGQFVKKHNSILNIIFLVWLIAQFFFGTLAAIKLF